MICPILTKNRVFDTHFPPPKYKRVSLCVRVSRPPILQDEIFDGDLKPIKDQILTKMVASPGLTMGKFMFIDRTVVVTMISVTFTVVIVWLQFNSKAGS
ncbi:hypothetical protein L596_014683 [Steinernema carpocapsae]|uniref:Uncharacterized protein n=1 Tax=Steinernema carpocapsae TaxID=34508 RepID=A0A4U5NCL4_STECR|nr:hypothetical protein L596_014683 [Steinernema carpocapsae]